MAKSDFSYGSSSLPASSSTAHQTSLLPSPLLSEPVQVSEEIIPPMSPQKRGTTCPWSGASSAEYSRVSFEIARRTSAYSSSPPCVTSVRCSFPSTVELFVFVTRRSVSFTTSRTVEAARSRT